MVGRAFSLEIWGSASVSRATPLLCGNASKGSDLHFFLFANGDSCCLGHHLAASFFLPFLIKNGTTVFSSLKYDFVALFTSAALSSQIDWKPINEDDLGSRKMCLCL